jgi:hypothetical protein
MEVSIQADSPSRQGPAHQPLGLVAQARRIRPRLPLDDPAQAGVAGVAVPPGDVAADHAALLAVGGVIRVGQWAAASNAELAYAPTNSSWMNRPECQFTALREFTLNGTACPSW